MVFGCGCECGNWNVDGTETDREIRSEGSYLKYLRRRFNSRLGGFSFLGFGALCCCLSAHSSARRKDKKKHNLPIWKLAPSWNEIWVQCRTIEKMNKCELALMYFKLEHVKRILIEPTSCSRSSWPWNAFLIQFFFTFSLESRKKYRNKKQAASFHFCSLDAKVGKWSQAEATEKTES